MSESKSAVLAHFEDGDIGKINPELPLDEQAYFLPFDRKKYEFPRNQLQIGIKLGSGHYGYVHKATARNILPYKKETTVAVKTPNNASDEVGIHVTVYCFPL